MGKLELATRLPVARPPGVMPLWAAGQKWAAWLAPLEAWRQAWSRQVAVRPEGVAPFSRRETLATTDMSISSMSRWRQRKCEVSRRHSVRMMPS